MDACLVDHPDIVACAAELTEVASKIGIVPFDEAAGAGDLRYAWFKTDGEGAVLVTLVTRARETRVAALAEALQRPASVAWCVQSGDGNAIRGDDLIVLRGDGALSVAIAGHTIDVGPLGFLQPNPRMAEVAYAALVGEKTGELALDLYAGAGTTTALLRKHFKQVRACEAYAESAAALGIAASRAEDFLAELVATNAAPTLIVANPPRAGLGEQVCAHLNALATRAHVDLRIMSCEPRALKRDLDRLDNYFFMRAQAFDMLPQTAHVEVVIALSSKKQI